jgi:5'-3' exonuclease
MGINNLNKFIRDTSPGIFQEIHLSQYAFMRIAIDISLYLHKFKAVCGDRWLSAFINLIASLRRNEVHCVFIFDGKAPPEKEAEQARRRADREKMEKQVWVLEEALHEWQATGVIAECLSDLYARRRSPKRLLASKREVVSMEWIEEKIQQKKNQLYSISSVDFETAKELFTVLNVPFYTAPFEAEKTCSKLCIDGHVDAVLSEDTDVIAYGAPVFLSKIDTGSDTCVRVSHPDLLKELELGSREFLDLCIMCGTDYNTNIPKIGSKTAYKHILEHRNIDKIAETGIDVTVLNHIRVRELFTQFEDTGIASIPYCGRPDFATLQEFVVRHDIQTRIDKIKENFIREIQIADSDSDVVIESETDDDVPEE